MSDERLKMLRAPFPEHQINLLPKPYKKDSPKGNCKECGGYHGLPAMHLQYVGHAALTDRLLDVDPGWSWEPLAYTSEGLPKLDQDGGLWIRLKICDVTRLGYGDAQGKTGGDAMKERIGDAMKERIGDAIRNAAMRFGAALELWHKGDLHLDEDTSVPEAKPEAKPEVCTKASYETEHLPMLTSVASKGIEALKEAYVNLPACPERNALWKKHSGVLKGIATIFDKKAMTEINEPGATG